MTILEESFGKESGQGAFTIEDVQLPQGSDHVWKASNYNETYYMMASAYVNDANQDSESRLVSPVLDLTGKNSVILTFDHTFKTFAADTHLEDLKLEVREEGGDVWTEVGIPTYLQGKIISSLLPVILNWILIQVRKFNLRSIIRVRRLML